jgi:hypothetical protein
MYMNIYCTWSHTLYMYHVHLPVPVHAHINIHVLYMSLFMFMLMPIDLEVGFVPEIVSTKIKCLDSFKKLLIAQWNELVCKIFSKRKTNLQIFRQLRQTIAGASTLWSGLTVYLSVHTSHTVYSPSSLLILLLVRRKKLRLGWTVLRTKWTCCSGAELQ